MMSAKDQEQRKLLESIQRGVEKLAVKMESEQIAEYVQLMNRPRKLIVMNLISGISRGVGIVIGITLFTAFILYLLRALGALNLPIIGDYIADLVEIVEGELNRRTY